MPSPIEIILVPSLIIILGYFLKVSGMFKAKDSVLLSKIVLNVSLPSLVFVNLVNANIHHDMLFLPIVSFILSMICVFISLLFSKIRGYSRKKAWTILIATAMMNTGFLGFPITLGVFGNEGFLNAIFFDLSTTILFVLFGVILVNQFGGNRRQVLKEALSFIPLWAVLFALIFNVFDIRLVGVLENTLNYLGQATVPLIMISLGLNLNFSDIKHSLTDSIFVSIVRLVVSPCIMFLLLVFISLDVTTFKVAILESGMATAMNALVLAINYDLDVKLMSSIIFTDTILALFSLTFLISFLI